MTIPIEAQQYIDALPLDTTYIDLSSRWINTLPDLSRFTNLQGLDCSFNNFTSFPDLPETLLYFNCQHNKLTQLSKLNSNLLELRCMHNLITSLPHQLPTQLNTFCFWGNPIYYQIGQTFKLPGIVTHPQWMYLLDQYSY